MNETLRRPQSTESQQSILAPLQSLVSTVPACEAWITFLQKADLVYATLTTGALQNLASMANALAKVFDYLYQENTQSIYSSQYLLTLAITARQTATSAKLAAPLATGNIHIKLNQAAQTALNTLDAWDPVQGYQSPDHPGALATTLVQGTVVG